MVMPNSSFGETVFLSGVNPRRELIVFLAFAFLLIAAGIGLRDPWPADEPRFTLAAKQMVESGDWLFPQRGNELYADKPPLFMAMQAAAYSLVGNWRIAFLLPSLLAALGTLWLVYDLGRRLWDHRTGLYGAIALLFVVQFTFQAKKAQIDPTVCFFITLACYGLLRHFLLGPNWRSYWLGCFAAGLGVITKGVGVLALLLFVPYLYARWRHWNQLASIPLSSWRWWLGLATFLIAVALWLVPMLFYVNLHPSPEYSAYAKDILFHQTAQRYSESWHHLKPWWYHLGVMLALWAPLSFAYPAVFLAWRKRLAERDARFLLPLVWIVLVVTFFSFSAGKRDVYIMPALPMLALVSAPFLPALIERTWVCRLVFIFVSLLTIISFFLGFSVLLSHTHFDLSLASEYGFNASGFSIWGMLFAIAGVGAVSLAVFRLRRAVWGLLTTLTAIWLLFSLWGYPLINPSSSARGVMDRVAVHLAADAELGMVAWKEQNLLQADRPAKTFGFSRPFNQQLHDAILWIQQSPQKRWVFINEDAMSPCIDTSLAISVGRSNRRDWWLFRSDAIVAACRDGSVPLNPKDIDQDNGEG